MQILYKIAFKCVETLPPDSKEEKKLNKNSIIANVTAFSLLFRVAMYTILGILNVTLKDCFVLLLFLKKK